jgi:hypothetical protein
MKDQDGEYQLRQIRQIAFRLDQFEQGKIKLSSLIQDIRGLLAALPATDKQWKQAMEAEWWTLEQIYAVSLDRGSDALLTSNRLLISEAVSNMRALLRKKEGQPGG